MMHIAKRNSGLATNHRELGAVNELNSLEKVQRNASARPSTDTEDLGGFLTILGRRAGSILAATLAGRIEDGAHRQLVSPPPFPPPPPPWPGAFVSRFPTWTASRASRHSTRVSPALSRCMRAGETSGKEEVINVLSVRFTLGAEVIECRQVESS